MHLYYAFGSDIYSFSSVSTYVFLVWQIYFFVLYIPITFEILHICISIPNTNDHEMLGDSHKYFTIESQIFSSHLCSFKYSLFGSHICVLQMCIKFILQFINILNLAPIFVL